MDHVVRAPEQIAGQLADQQHPALGWIRRQNESESGFGTLLIRVTLGQRDLAWDTGAMQPLERSHLVRHFQCQNMRSWAEREKSIQGGAA
jgi:hypothetical protein